MIYVKHVNGDGWPFEQSLMKAAMEFALNSIVDTFGEYELDFQWSESVCVKDLTNSFVSQTHVSFGKKWTWKPVSVSEPKIFLHTTSIIYVGNYICPWYSCCNIVY